MILTLVSGNKHKFSEIRKKLRESRIGLRWLKASLNEAEGNSLKETAREKAKQAFELVEGPVITEDTGVFFEAFRDFPGSRAKRVYEKISFEGLLEKLEGKSRKARFETIICFTADGKNFKYFRGILRGVIDKRVHDREKDVLPYEKIFIPEGMNKTLSSISRKEKNKFSHRAIATEKLAKWLNKNVKKIAKQ